MVDTQLLGATFSEEPINTLLGQLSDSQKLHASKYYYIILLLLLLYYYHTVTHTHTTHKTKTSQTINIILYAKLIYILNILLHGSQTSY